MKNYQIDPDAGEEYLTEVAGRNLRPKDVKILSKYQLHYLQLWKKYLLTSPYGMKRMREIYAHNKSENFSFSYLHEEYGNHVKKKEARNHGPEVEEILAKFYRARSRDRAKEQIEKLRVSTDFCHKLWNEFPPSKRSKTLTDSYNSMIKYRNRIVEGNYKLVAFVASNYINRIGSGVSFDDLIQEGRVGLLRAVEKFDPYKGVTFSTYAVWWIKQSMTKTIRKHTYTIIPPAHIYELQDKLSRLKAMLRVRDNKEPTIEDLAKELKVNVDSLSNTIGTMDSSYNVVAPGEDYLFVEDNNPMHFDLTPYLMKRLRGMIKRLNTRERIIIEQRFGLKGNNSHTLEEVGDMFNISRERVRQIESEVIENFRKKLRKFK